MRLEIPYDKTFSPSDFNLDNIGLAIVDYFELLGTIEYNHMTNYERVQQVCQLPLPKGRGLPQSH